MFENPYQAPNVQDPKGKAPSAGRVRCAIGLVLFVLGVLLSLRVGWLGLSYGSGFRESDWFLFIVLLTMGISISTAGCWLAYRLRIAIWMLILSAVCFLAYRLAEEFV